jgi:hypothetical protein
MEAQSGELAADITNSSCPFRIWQLLLQLLLAVVGQGLLQMLMVALVEVAIFLLTQRITVLH